MVTTVLHGVGFVSAWNRSLNLERKRMNLKVNLSLCLIS
jgi:hypothetical protein